MRPQLQQVEAHAQKPQIHSGQEETVGPSHTSASIFHHTPEYWAHEVLSPDHILILDPGTL